MWSCPGPSMYLSEWINWIISSFPQWISKILFVLGSWDHFGSMGCRNRECPFRYVLVLFLGSVLYRAFMLLNIIRKVSFWQEVRKKIDESNFIRGYSKQKESKKQNCDLSISRKWCSDIIGKTILRALSSQKVRERERESPNYISFLGSKRIPSSFDCVIN